jgi:hypothetical protein
MLATSFDSLLRLPRHAPLTLNRCAHRLRPEFA